MKAIGSQIRTSAGRDECQSAFSIIFGNLQNRGVVGSGGQADRSTHRWLSNESLRGRTENEQLLRWKWSCTRAASMVAPVRGV